MRRRSDVGELDRRAEHDAPVRSISAGLITCAMREPALDLRDAPFDEPLPLLRGIVIGVLGEVAVRARLGDGAI
jgi:hypothetical protein